MTIEEYKIKKATLEKEYTLAKEQLDSEYAFTNYRYKIGDIFTDHMGSIKIEDIFIYKSYDSDVIPSCVYFGLELKKNGKPTKRGTKRMAWQFNEITK